MPIVICSKCKKPIMDSYHEFEECCKCDKEKKKEKEDAKNIK